jgi:hypothetical protein
MALDVQAVRVRAAAAVADAVGGGLVLQRKRGHALATDESELSVPMMVYLMDEAPLRGKRRF